MPTKISQDEEQRQLERLEYEIQYHETVEHHHPILPTITEPKLPKRRGPKKKQMTPSRVARFKVRRIKANGRERERMKGLNDQLEVLRETIPCFALSQKLSKIETLRLAKNYIEALTQMISSNQVPDNTQFAQLLCKDLSPNTMNLVAATLSLNPRMVHQNDQNYPISFDDTFMLSSSHPRVNNPLEFINLKKTLNESEDDTGMYSSNSYDQDYSSTDDMNCYSSNEQQQYLHYPDHSFYYDPRHY